jgi:hypothetical protein
MAYIGTKSQIKSIASMMFWNEDEPFIGPSINDVTIFLRRRGQKLRTADDPYGVVQLREY